MFTKYHFTLTVIMLINLCGCYTVTPSAKSASIGGKDCKTVWNVSYQQLIVKSKLLHNGNLSIEDFWRHMLILVVSETRRCETSYIFVSSFVHIQFHFHLKQKIFISFFFHSSSSVLRFFSSLLPRNFVSRVWILWVHLHVTIFFFPSIVEVCASHNAMCCWIMCENFSRRCDETR